ncbi:6264_t:CDS:2, partial [Rhizophagus irregularis]
MVKNLKNHNDLLLKAIRPRPEQFALQVKYVFEFRVVLLIHIAQCHDCTFKLMESGVFDIGHESGPALIKVSRFVSRHQGLILKILTDISPVNLLVSPNVEVKDNVILSIGIVHKMFRIFYFLGVKLEVIDK